VTREYAAERAAGVALVFVVALDVRLDA